jgi:hypothetical protein
VVLGFPCLDDEQASMQFGTTSAFSLMDDTMVDTHTKERIPECLLMPYGKLQKLVRRTRRRKGHNLDFFVIHVSPAAEQPAELHTGEKLTA